MRRVPQQDYSAHVRKHRSHTVRVVLVIAGTAFVALGVLGVFLPVLPTTPFLLLAAACYARASTRFYNWLLNSPGLGPVILEWHEHRSIPYRAKRMGLLLMAASFGLSIAVVREPWLKALLALLGVILGAWLYRIPSRDAPHRP